MKYIATLISIVGFSLSTNVLADYSTDVVHYNCDIKEQKITIIYEQLINEEGSFYDKPNSGAYDPNTLIEINEEAYRFSKASKISPITKICTIGGKDIKTEIHYNGTCQDGALALIKLFAGKKELYKTKGFGTSCSAGFSSGPELVNKITITPTNVFIESGLWYR